MVKKKLDSRITSLLETGSALNHRSMFVLVGDKAREQIPNLHYLVKKNNKDLKKLQILWCYNKDLDFSSNRRKRSNQLKREIARGIRDPDEDDPFELFVSTADIRYCYYKETDAILGNTFSICILQDFESLTPNLLARTIETVKGGGIIVLLLRSMTSLKQLFTLNMDVHSRYRTHAHQDTASRFNERFLLSLSGCDSCLVLDDELNVLPISAGKNITPANYEQPEVSQPLLDLKESMKESLPVGSLINECRTLDQAKTLLQFCDMVSEQSLKSTCSLVASRGRGKSATLGLAIAAAVGFGYSNIFLTSPSPENLKTLFEFIFKGFDALGYTEHTDYDIMSTVTTSKTKCIVRVNIFRDHRQTIQWIQPTDYQMLAQAELVVIDEAAAIPLPVVKNLIGNYLVFMASTVNGYEGTGRSLSLKLIKQLRQESVGGVSSDLVEIERNGKDTKVKSMMKRSLREMTLNEPIRYNSGDQVEKWLNNLLCLDINSFKSLSSSAGCPHPSKCDLYYVTRDTLFSYHPVSELFLQKMMDLYVSSHYKNSPNDLQLMSDAPAHHLFVLLPPITADTVVPEPLVVLQVCLEGQITKGAALASLSRGIRQAGDLIPWVISQQFQDDDFASLSGARVVRIATHPDYTGMGYGKRAVEQMHDYYSGKIGGLEETEEDPEPEFERVSEKELESACLQTETIAVRDANKMPPLLLKLSERPLKTKLDWIGVSFGITQPLHKFWKKCGYSPVYLRQTANDLTGEHTCIMLRQNEASGAPISMENSKWLDLFALDFRKRFLELLAFQFKEFSPSLVLSVLDAADSEHKVSAPITTSAQVSPFYSSFDLKRLESYSQNLLDYHVIMDLVPSLARFYFLGSFTDLKVSAVQGAILLGLGLQKKNVERLEIDLGITVSQILALFAKSVKKMSLYLNAIITEGVSEQVQSLLSSSTPLAGAKDINNENHWNPTAVSLDEDLQAGANESMQLREAQKELVDSLDLKAYAINGTDADWESAKGLKTLTDGKILQVKGGKKKRKDIDNVGVADGLMQKHLKEAGTRVSKKSKTKKSSKN